MSTNAERQAAFKARMKAEGKRQLTVWVTPAQAAAIRAYLEGEPLPVTQPQPTPEAREGKPKLRQGDKPGEWRVFVDGREIGTVTKRHYPKSLGLPAFDRWRIHRKGSAFDGLSTTTYETRNAAVVALCRGTLAAH